MIAPHSVRCVAAVDLSVTSTYISLKWELMLGPALLCFARWVMW